MLRGAHRTGVESAEPEANMSRYISRDQEIMGGVPCFSGTRVPIQNLFDYLESASSINEFLTDFPSVSRSAAVALLEEAKCSLLRNAAAA
jgi:uncharacterized protein (DUF433 family)